MKTKRLGDRSFTNRNWDCATKKYNLDFLFEPESDSDELSTDAETSYGESISLEITDQEDNEDKGIDEGQEKLQHSKRERNKAPIVTMVSLMKMLWILKAQGKVVMWED
ncbi:hypothetical protein O181_096661 [Austropuccinia psidii MF-1]|uniref:Uncharacterized protein n=1 Tax=Austropuccinia psidii MF-1 TaxID=1389203 RepID=A0A9Q3J7H2_9BASI|nr:hypothetical protein [Austropuccinia psidii MF-1]